jgi:hypothetical protein
VGLTDKTSLRSIRNRLNSGTSEMKVILKPIFAVILLSLICLSPVFAQKKNSNKYYKDMQGELYTKKQFDSLLEESVAYTIRLVGQTKSGDSTIIFFDRITDQVSRNEVDPYIYKSLPSFSYQDMDGNTITPESFKGKIVYVRLWSVRNQSCIDEIPELNRLRKKYNNNPNVMFVSFCPDKKELTARLLSQIPFNFTVIPEAMDYFQKLKITDYPVNVFLDTSGTIRKIMEGVPINVRTLDNLSFEQYDKILQDLLKQNKTQ